jgi:hypothetical protein
MGKERVSQPGEDRVIDRIIAEIRKNTRVYFKDTAAYEDRRDELSRQHALIREELDKSVRKSLERIVDRLLERGDLPRHLSRGEVRDMIRLTEDDEILVCYDGVDDEEDEAIDETPCECASCSRAEIMKMLEI